MIKKSLALLIASVSILAFSSACKKTSSKPVNPNSAHALSNTYYVRGLLDTTWVYQGNDNKEECQTSGSVCADFLTYGANASFVAVKFQLTDSAHPAPKDTTILSWIGKTFVAANDTTVSHAYTFSFEYPDSTGREMSTLYVPYNHSATLTVQSVTYNGLSQYYFDSITPYKSYLIKGTVSGKITHLGDTVLHNLSQGVFAINVIEAK